MKGSDINILHHETFNFREAWHFKLTVSYDMKKKTPLDFLE